MTVWVRFTDLAIGELSDSDAIWIEDIFLSIGKLNCFYARLLYFLNRSVWENAFLFTVFKYALNCAVREAKRMIVK